MTGYGTKQGAGWTMPFEASGIKVFRPKPSPDTDFYLRCSGNTRVQMTAQIYVNMTDINTGDLKLQCASPFKYLRGAISGKWVLIASPRGFWFFNEQTDDYVTSVMENCGAYFFAGDVYSQNKSNVYMQHTGGDNDGAYSSLLRTFAYTFVEPDEESVYTQGVLLQDDGSVLTTDAYSIAGWDGTEKTLDNFVLAPIIINTATDLFVLPGIFTSADGVTKQNFDEVSAASSVALTSTIVFGTGTTSSSNFYISTDYWVH